MDAQAGSLRIERRDREYQPESMGVNARRLCAADSGYGFLPCTRDEPGTNIGASGIL